MMQITMMTRMMAPSWKMFARPRRSTSYMPRRNPRYAARPVCMCNVFGGKRRQGPDLLSSVGVQYASGRSIEQCHGRSVASHPEILTSGAQDVARNAPTMTSTGPTTLYAKA